MSENNTNNNLGILGYGGKESTVYAAILALGQANVLEISQEANIPRATIYGILNKLIDDGLVSSVVRGKRKHYLAENPEKLRKVLQNREAALEEILPHLKMLYRQKMHRPEIRVFDGEDGIKKMLDDILLTMPNNSTYDAILNSKDEFETIGSYFDSHVKSRIKKRINIRLITEKSDYTKGWEKTQKELMRQVKFLPRGQHFSVSYHIYGNKVSMFSLQGPVVGVIIENKEIADMERLQFEYMWKGLK